MNARVVSLSEARARTLRARLRALHECDRFTYREAGPLVWRVCLDCARTEKGRWVHGVSVAGGPEPEGA